MAAFFKSAALRISALAALGLAATTASAIERTVPGDHGTIALALAAASDGDVIRITDSGVYTDQLVINKSVQIIADAGFNPVIRLTDDQATAVPGVIVTTGAQGGSLGSLDGGRITVDRNTTEGSTVSGRVGIFINGIDTGQTYSIQNVLISAFTQGGIAIGNLTGYSTAVGLKGTLNLNGVEIDGGHTVANSAVGASKMGIRVLGNAANFTGTVNLNRVKVHRINSHAIGLNHSSNARLDDFTVNVDTCELTTFNSGAINVGNAKNFSNTVTNSFLLGGGDQNSWGAYRYSSNTAQGPPGGTITISNSALTVWPLAGIQCVVGLPTANNGDNIALTINHCDIINRLGGGYVSASVLVNDGIPRPRSAITIAGGTGRTLNITNNNIYGPEVASTVTLAGITFPTSTAGDTVNVHHNNVFVSGEAYVNLTPGAGEVIPGVDPGFVDVENRDFRVTNPAIMTASTTGTPLGTNRIFVNFVPVELSAFGLQ